MDNRIIETPASTLDIYPTVLAAAGISEFGEKREIDGQNILPLLRGKTQSHEKDIYLSYQTANYGAMLVRDDITLTAKNQLVKWTSPTKYTNITNESLRSEMIKEKKRIQASIEVDMKKAGEGKKAALQGVKDDNDKPVNLKHFMQLENQKRMADGRTGGLAGDNKSIHGKPFHNALGQNISRNFNWGLK